MSSGVEMCAVKMVYMIRRDHYIHKSIVLIMKMVLVVSTRALFYMLFFCPTRLRWFDCRLPAVYLFLELNIIVLSGMFTTVQYVSY